MYRTPPPAPTSSELLSLESLILDKLSSKGNLRIALSKVFDYADLDKSGDLTTTELSTALSTLIPGIETRIITALASWYDKDGGGTISKSELLKRYASP